MRTTNDGAADRARHLDLVYAQVDTRHQYELSHQLRACGYVDPAMWSTTSVCVSVPGSSRLRPLTSDLPPIISYTLKR